MLCCFIIATIQEYTGTGRGHLQSQILSCIDVDRTWESLLWIQFGGVRILDVKMQHGSQVYLFDDLEVETLDPQVSFCYTISITHGQVRYICFRLLAILVVPCRAMSIIFECVGPLDTLLDF